MPISSPKSPNTVSALTPHHPRFAHGNVQLVIHSEPTDNLRLFLPQVHPRQLISRYILVIHSWRIQNEGDRPLIASPMAWRMMSTTMPGAVTIGVWSTGCGRP